MIWSEPLPPHTRTQVGGWRGAPAHPLVRVPALLAGWEWGNWWWWWWWWADGGMKKSRRLQVGRGKVGRPKSDLSRVGGRVRDSWGAVRGPVIPTGSRSRRSRRRIHRTRLVSVVKAGDVMMVMMMVISSKIRVLRSSGYEVLRVEVEARVSHGVGVHPALLIQQVTHVHLH